VNDSQWPRYEVFLQERVGKPHRSVGTVHAPDSELALLNGRDLFVRRPNCSSLWVAPTSAVYAMTNEELGACPESHQLATKNTAPAEIYFVFLKDSQRRAMSYVQHVGSVEASSPTEAMQRAIKTYGSAQAYVWWVCPARAIRQSEATDIESMFAPANEKSYRRPNQYRTVEAMRNVDKTEQAHLDTDVNDAA
jgi:ring-1,2-phenylacetyl-CoA epoxidase subunit PaaB